MDNKPINFNKKEISNIKKIQHLYDNLTYFDNYGGSLFLFIILTITVFIVVSYCYVSTHISKIRKNWVSERCKPYIIPFAGMINKPENMTAEEYTEQNFNFCTQTILKAIGGFAVEPLEFIAAATNATMEMVVEGLQHIREMISKYRENSIKVAEDIMNVIMNMIPPLEVIIIEFGDIISKVQGSVTAALYTTVGVYMSLQVLLDIIAEGVVATMIIISVLLFALALIITALYLAIVTIPIALELQIGWLAMLQLYIALMIPLSVALGILEDDFGATVWDLPPLPPPPPLPPSQPPSCFDKNTILVMNDGTKKKIVDIQVGDKLINDNMVTAKLELSALDSQMYILDDIIVSGTHSVKINNNWVKINSCNQAKKIENYNEKYIYCLNTEQKYIVINGFIFYDWDEICEDDIETIRIIHKADKYNTNKERNNNFDSKMIHKFFDGGFINNTKIKLINGSEKEIKDIKIHDVLEKGEKVYGIVEIDGKHLNNQYIYNLGNYNKQIIGGPNLNLCDTNVKITTTLGLNKSSNHLEFNKQDKLYHLLTDKKTFYVNGLRFYDYNTSIEILLEKNKGKILSMKYV